MVGRAAAAPPRSGVNIEIRDPTTPAAVVSTAIDRLDKSAHAGVEMLRCTVSMQPAPKATTAHVGSGKR
jgi:hypothetical protein